MVITLRVRCLAAVGTAGEFRPYELQGYEMCPSGKVKITSFLAEDAAPQKFSRHDRGNMAP